MPPDTKNAPDDFIAARIGLRAQVEASAGAETITVPVASIKQMLRGIPPDPELPKSHCQFDAGFVPFLRHTISAQALDGYQRSTMGGITVTPYADGGAVLAATNGRVLLLARDPSAVVSEGGCRLLMPPEAMDACAAPKPTEFFDQGDVFEADPPAWLIPDRVWSLGPCLLVIPKEQPPDPGRKEEDGVMLWSGGIETSNHWRETDGRRLDPVKWWKAVARLPLAQSQAVGPSWIGAEVMRQVAAAMQCAPHVQFWQTLSYGSITVWIPTAVDNQTAAPRSDLAIVAMGAHRLQNVGIPSWVLDCVPPAEASNV